MDRTVTEADLRQMRDEVERLFAEAQAALRRAQAANSDYRAACIRAHPVEMKGTNKQDAADES